MMFTHSVLRTLTAPVLGLGDGDGLGDGLGLGDGDGLGLGDGGAPTIVSRKLTCVTPEPTVTPIQAGLCRF
jgi:hypothetical protein